MSKLYSLVIWRPYLHYFIFKLLLIMFHLQGYGTNFYSYTEYYEGEWYADKRSGWGRMYYSDGAVYEGEWYNNMRNGEGMLRLGKL